MPGERHKQTDMHTCTHPKIHSVNIVMWRQPCSYSTGCFTANGREIHTVHCSPPVPYINLSPCFWVKCCGQGHHYWCWLISFNGAIILLHLTALWDSQSLHTLGEYAEYIMCVLVCLVFLQHINKQEEKNSNKSVAVKCWLVILSHWFSVTY